MTKASLNYKSFLSRFPGRKAIRKVFNIILFPVVFWTLLIFSKELPAYLLRMSAWDVVGVLAYVLVIALVDSVLLLSILVFISWIIPGSWQHLSFEIWGTLLALGIILSTMTYHLRGQIVELLPFLSYLHIFWILPTAVFLLVIALASNSKYTRRTEAVVGQFLERVDLIASLFLALVCASIAVVIARNLGIH